MLKAFVMAIIKFNRYRDYWSRVELCLHSIVMYVVRLSSVITVKSCALYAVPLVGQTSASLNQQETVSASIHPAQGEPEAHVSTSPEV